MAKRNRSTTAQLLNLYGNRVDPQDTAQRFAERDARDRNDTRTEAQKYLGDPEPSRSALAQGLQRGSAPQRGKAWRVDLWGKK